METQYTTFIERYFDKDLTATELIEYQELLETNLDFQKEVELFEKALKAIKLKHISDMKDHVRSIRNKKINSSTSSKLGWMRIAASIVLLAVVGLGFYAQQYKASKLYENAYAPAGDYITNMDADMSTMEKAMELYNKEELTAAIEAFAEIENTNPENQVAKFYLGQSLLQAGQDEQAIKTLSQVSGDYHPEALWYVALTQLKMGNETAALESLDHIIEENRDEAFVIKAGRLKRKLNSYFRKLAL